MIAGEKDHGRRSIGICWDEIIGNEYVVLSTAVLEIGGFYFLRRCNR